ncbi:putative Serine-threonin protein phosphatase [Leishmania mexicana MHOM/GT/2001/U1103]|uniref:Serine-threonin protein phosphatase n=1 Tax=Leishmania mexicana (strain MHOM/GT/2001/U1103) TaxID=929439 RepID=E9AVY1_LEIMU|nr:putative Serine-threonin protein phosphatase [Leishmania mexicana MHOM/GT/2001/U1103]CBZ27114.1 putative Serine-threonin protein phosphatase [Leishmania mexicana MHOM/GT/2001/U1103]
MKVCALRIGCWYGGLLLSFYLLLLSCPAHCERKLVEVHRIIAVGDVHGDADNFLRILRIANLIEDSVTGASGVLDNPPRWKYSMSPTNGTAVRTTLVQVGDLIDRGEQDLQVLNIAISLQEQTAQSGSQDEVVLLIGNHELLNIQGHYHYVNKNNYGGFLSKALRAEGMRATGAFGQYIVDNFKAGHLDEGVLFVHAGIETSMKIKDVEALNTDVREALRQGIFRHSLLGSSGPLWTRKMIIESMSGECSDVRAALKQLNATRVVVGHTAQESGHIGQHCDGQVLAIDVGMSRWMYDKVAALELVFSKYTDNITGTGSASFVVRELREGVSGFCHTCLEERGGLDTTRGGDSDEENDIFDDL